MLKTILWAILAIVLIAGAIIVAKKYTLHKNTTGNGRHVTTPARVISGVLAIIMIVGAVFSANHCIAAFKARENDKTATIEETVDNAAEAEEVQEEESTETADTNVNLSFQSGDDGSDQKELEEGYMEAINFAEINLKALYGVYHNDYISWETMPLTVRWRTAASGYSDAVGFPFKMDPRWVEEQIGFVRNGESSSNLDDNIAKLQLNDRQKARVLEALKEEKKARAEEYKKMSDEEKDVFVHDTRVNKLLHNNILMLDSFYQFLASDEYFTRNNAKWIQKGKEYLDNTFDSEHGIAAFMQYQAGHENDPAYLQVVEKINELADQAAYVMDNAKFRGVIKATSERNWHFDATMEVDDNHIRLVENKEQETGRYWFVFDFVSKTGGIQKRIGFNKADSRLGVLSLEKPKTDKTKDTPKPDDPDPKPNDDPEPDKKPKKVSYVISYLDKDTKEPVHEAEVGELKVGESKKFKALTVEGYTKCTPTEAILTAKKAGKTLYHTFYYKKKGETPPPKIVKYNLTVVRKFNNGVVIDRKSLGKKAAGEQYAYTAPNLAGYTASPKYVSDVMPKHDVTIVITYTPIKRDDPPRDGEGAKNHQNSTNNDKNADKTPGKNDTGNQPGPQKSYNDQTTVYPDRVEQDAQQQREEEAQRVQDQQEAERTAGVTSESTVDGQAPANEPISSEGKDSSAVETEVKQQPDGSTTTVEVTTPSLDNEKNTEAVDLGDF